MPSKKLSWKKRLASVGFTAFVVAIVLAACSSGEPRPEPTSTGEPPAGQVQQGLLSCCGETCGTPGPCNTVRCSGVDPSCFCDYPEKADGVACTGGLCCGGGCCTGGSCCSSGSCVAGTQTTACGSG